MSLEMRLKHIAEARAVDLQRIRRQLAFDRFLSRVFLVAPDQFCLKGGYAMELIFSNARTTKDIDLVTLKNNTNSFESLEIYQALRDMVEVDMYDYFSFKISGPKKDLENPIHGGVRFSVDALIDSRRFVNFRIDVISDLFYDQPQKIQLTDWLGFSDIAPCTIHIISLEQQLAEKLHAYTLPPVMKNSRVKDFIDIILIIQQDDLDQNRVLINLKKIFQSRKTHAIPLELHRPPKNWATPYEKMRLLCGVEESLATGFDKINEYYLNLLNKSPIAK